MAIARNRCQTPAVRWKGTNSGVATLTRPTPWPNPRKGSDMDDATASVQADGPEIKAGTVYVLFDAEDQVLYVGVTSQTGMQRFTSGHGKDKPWWRDVVRAEFHHCSTRWMAFRLESVLIHDLDPKYNIMRKWAFCPDCGERKTQRGRLCVACRDYQQRTGVPRPDHVIEKTRVRRQLEEAEYVGRS